MHNSLNFDKLGIIAGSGSLSCDIIYELSNLGKKSFIAYIADGDYSNLISNHLSSDVINSLEYEANNFNIAEVGKILNFFKKNNIENIIFVGGIQRPNFKSLKPDFKGSILLAKILKEIVKGDDAILRTIIKYTESQGFNVISYLDFLDISLIQSKILNIQNINKQDVQDIKIGMSILDNLGSSDVGQSVIVCDGYVLGIEAAEGTDMLIDRCAALRKKHSGGVLVKGAKSSQDMRIDVPTIGFKTIEKLIECKFNGIYIEKNKVLVCQSDKINQYLVDRDFFICNEI